MLGDNRDSSLDSRAIGLISRDLIVGRAHTVAFSVDYDDYYRNLPDIVTLRPEVVAGHESGDQPIGGKSMASDE